MKKNLKENEVILSVDFSWNYENKQVHEVQSAYFGHENFTLYTSAWYFHKSLGIDGKPDPNDLTVIPMAIISNESLSPATKSGESVLYINIFFVITPLKISFLGIGVLVMPDV